MAPSPGLQVTPAHAGVQSVGGLDSGFRRNDRGRMRLDDAARPIPHQHEGASMPADQRRYPRIPVELITFLKPRDFGTPPARAAVTDMSLAGAFVETIEPLAIGGVIELDLQLPSEGPQGFAIVPLTALVRWRKESTPMGVGIELLDVPQRERHRLSQFLDRCGNA